MILLPTCIDRGSRQCNTTNSCNCRINSFRSFSTPELNQYGCRSQELHVETDPVSIVDGLLDQVSQPLRQPNSSNLVFQCDDDQFSSRSASQCSERYYNDNLEPVQHDLDETVFSPDASTSSIGSAVLRHTSGVTQCD